MEAPHDLYKSSEFALVPKAIDAAPGVCEYLQVKEPITAKPSTAGRVIEPGKITLFVPTGSPIQCFNLIVGIVGAVDSRNGRAARIRPYRALLSVLAVSHAQVAVNGPFYGRYYAAAKPVLTPGFAQVFAAPPMMAAPVPPPVYAAPAPAPAPFFAAPAPAFAAPAFAPAPFMAQAPFATVYTPSYAPFLRTPYFIGSNKSKKN
ncbi:unnamed protein product [Heligmosomoides polygyrus]|uniref:GRAM domain-containing protein n=1 Tax=Heligmosomoides polygyrus TaxID=6339 RepID=A0A3P7YAQ7_HELPZ|nr:unnamed protein product [Heligmosomoides polygyrus]